MYLNTDVSFVVFICRRTVICVAQEPIAERAHKLLDKGNKEPLALSNLQLRYYFVLVIFGMNKPIIIAT